MLLVWILCSKIQILTLERGLGACMSFSKHKISKGNYHPIAPILKHTIVQPLWKTLNFLSFQWVMTSDCGELKTDINPPVDNRLRPTFVLRAFSCQGKGPGDEVGLRPSLVSDQLWISLSILMVWKSRDVIILLNKDYILILAVQLSIFPIYVSEWTINFKLWGVLKTCLPGCKITVIRGFMLLYFQYCSVVRHFCAWKTQYWQPGTTQQTAGSSIST